MCYILLSSKVKPGDVPTILGTPNCKTLDNIHCKEYKQALRYILCMNVITKLTSAE